MIRRGVALGLAVAVLSPALARAQGLEIDHKAVGCIVVGKYPKMNACFSPASQLARSRVYFRPEGTPSWYYVDMKSDQPCFSGTLPRPGKKLVGKKIEYYVEAQNKAFDAARTAEFDPIVVKSAQECKKDVPVAPFLNNATVAVFPAVPAGFVGGGIGTAAVIGIAGAGAAVAGTAAVVATNSNDTTTTTIVVGGNTTTTIAATTTTTTTTTTVPKTNKAPFAVLTTNPDPPSGQSPLTVTFDLCKSTDPDGDPLSFFFDFGDGSKASGSCLETHTYQAPFRAADDARALDKSYVAEASVVDPGNLSASRTRNVNVTSVPPPCPAPTIVLSPPPSVVTCTPLAVQASTSGASSVQFCSQGGSSGCSVPFLSSESAAPPPPLTCVAGVGSGGSFTASLPLVSGSFSSDCYAITATAKSGCSGQTAAAGPAFVFNFNSCSAPVRGTVAPSTVWSSDLSVDGGRLQLIVNGAAPAFPGRGRGLGTGRLVDGENRVEAILVESAGKPGLWRIDLRPSESILAGSLRVVSGEVVLLGPASATFRLSGQQGERIVFTFLKK